MTDLMQRMQEMLAGLDGVTPGPWFEDQSAPGMADSRVCQVGRKNAVALVANEIDGRHLARCDPDTLRQILTIAITAAAVNAVPDRLLRRE